MEFAWPWAALLVLAPLAIRRFLAPAASTRSALVVPEFARLQTASHPSSLTSARATGRLSLLWIIWILLVVALMQPREVGDARPLPTSGRDLMLAVDISGSMSTEDLELDGDLVDRLTVVKTVVEDFVERRDGDRVGLILFGTYAYLQAPLTFDLATLRELLRQAPVGIAGGKTAIGDAIGLAVKRLRDRPVDSRVIVLLTDGSNNIGEIEPRRAASIAGELGIRIHTIGVGSDQLAMPATFGNGQRLVNPSADLDEDTLISIAQRTGGQYFRAEDTSSLRSIYASIEELEPVETNRGSFRPVRDLFHWPLAAALVMFFLASFVMARRDD